MFSKKILPTITIAILLFGVAFPALAIDIWKGAKCVEVAGGGPTQSCDFCDALTVTQNIIGYLTELAFVIVIAMIVWGALQMVISAGSSEKFAHGKKGITDAVIGLLVIMATWLIINEFLHIMTGGLAIPWDQISC